MGTQKKTKIHKLAEYCVNTDCDKCKLPNKDREKLTCKIKNVY